MEGKTEGIWRLAFRLSRGVVAGLMKPERNRIYEMTLRCSYRSVCVCVCVCERTGLGRARWDGTIWTDGSRRGAGDQRGVGADGALEQRDGHLQGDGSSKKKNLQNKIDINNILYIFKKVNIYLF